MSSSIEIDEWMQLNSECLSPIFSKSSSKIAVLVENIPTFVLFIELNKLIKPPLNSFDKNLLFLLKKRKVLSYGKLNGNLFEPKKILI